MNTKKLPQMKAIKAVMMLLLLLVGGMKAYAEYDFSAQCPTGQTLYYRITDNDNHYVELVYPGSHWSSGWTGYNMPTGNITLQEAVEYNGVTYMVTSIGEYAFAYCYALTGSLTIPNTVITIEKKAFGWCGFNGTLTIGNSVTTIGESAFYGCDGFIGELVIPNSVTTIYGYDDDDFMDPSSGAFYHCSGFTSLTLSNSLTTIGGETFEGCSGLTGNMDIPNSVTKIGSGAFHNCSGLTSFSLPNSVSSIGSHAFTGTVWYNNQPDNTIIYLDGCCIGYKGSTSSGNLQIDEGTRLIAGAAFRYCSGYTGSLVIPNTVTEIGEEAFYGCSGFTGSLTIGNSVTTIGKGAFYNCNGFTGNLIIPSSVTTIGSYYEYGSNPSWGAFYGCSGFTGDLIIPNSVTMIGNECFSGCSGFSGTLTIPNSVTKIGHRAFGGCSGFTGDLTLPIAITKIGVDTFGGCSGFNGSLVIPNSVTRIDQGAFYNCSGFSSIISLAETPPVVFHNGGYTDVFYNWNHSINVYVPCGSIEAYATISWGGFNNFIETCPFVISVNANLEEGGTVTGSGTYQGGQTCTVTATANEGYTFMYWKENGNIVSFGSNYSFMVTGNRELVAYFTLPLTISATTNPENSGTIIGAGAYDYGSTCTLTATPNTGYHFINWTSNGFPFTTDSTFSFIVTEARTYVANFEPNSYEITTNVIPTVGGTVTGAGTYNHFETCTLTAIPNENYAFGNWTLNGNTVSTNAEYSFTVTGDAELTAHFFTAGNIVFDDANVKSICVTYWDSNNDGELSYAEAAQVTTLDNYFRNNTVISSFDELQYFVGLNTVNAKAFENCSSLSLVSLPNTITAVADSAFMGCSGLDTLICYPLVPPVWSESAFEGCSPTTIVRMPCGYEEAYESIEWGGFSNFLELCSYNVTVTADPSAGGTVTGSGHYENGETCTVTATVNPNYTFLHWTKNGLIVSTDLEYTFTVEENTAMVARYLRPGNIPFADANVKAICVAHWDTNNDGEISYAEAAAVTDLGNWFQENTVIFSFSELRFFIGLTAINNHAFYNCTNLASIQLPYSLEIIGDYAFYGCTGLIGVLNLPNALTYIGNWAFYNCNGLLANLTIPDRVVTIGEAAFKDCTGFMGLLTLGKSLTTIGNSAFAYCDNLTGGITIPNSVITIGNGAFMGCTAFWGTLTLGNSLTTIGNSAFSGCTGLVGDVTIPNTVTSIGPGAFYNCHSFGGVLTIPSSVTSIGSSAFSDCYGFSEVHFNATNCADVSSTAFNGCSGTFTIGDNVQRIPANMFGYANFTGHLIIPSSVTLIGNSAFYYCDNFTGGLDIPNSVTNIGSYAFYNCYGLNGTLTISNAMTTINESTFRSCSGLSGNLVIPNSVISIGDNAFYNCHSFTGTMVLPNSLNTIGISAFESCYGLSEIITGNNLMVLGNTAFKSCFGLTKVTLPYLVTVIGIEAFRYCNNLAEVNIQSMQAPSIGWDVFSDNAFGRVINIPCGATPNYSVGYWSEWASALHEMCDGYVITTEVNPTEAGSVTGAGTYDYSEMCTLTATSNLGYPFLNWTKNGVIVSTDPVYTFGVTESCTYVANFASEPVSYTITVTANPAEGGTVTGAGSYLYGETATITATANTNYQFINWTKDGEVISTSPSFTFTVIETGSYVANFEENLATYDITATSNPAEGGTITGAGSYQEGETCTLTATPNQGYHFVNWTRDNVEVSTEASYSFTVTESASYVANFELNVYITSAGCIPQEGGTIQVEGTGVHGSTVTLTAVPNAGYVFVNWTKNDEVVSTSPVYSFTITESASYWANFEVEPVTLHWTPTTGGTSGSMVLIGKIQIDGVDQTSDQLEVGVFCGNECRGAAIAYHYTFAPQSIDYYRVSTMVFGDAGDSFSFKLYDHSLGQELDLTSPAAIAFDENGYGTAFEPYVLNFTTAMTQTQALATGWSWYSTYIEQSGIDGLAMLENSMDTACSRIQSRTEFIDNLEYMGYHFWDGTLSAITNEQSYRIRTTSPCEAVITGQPALPENHPITVNPGWNWIGFPSAQPLSLTSALSAFAPEVNDQIKGRYNFATYLGNYGGVDYWDGMLTTLEPGQGYMYRSFATTAKTLVYQTGSKGETQGNGSTEGNVYQPASGAYADNMTVTAEIELNGSALRRAQGPESYELAVFVGDECRGSVKLKYVEPLDRYEAFLMVFGDGGEELSFVLTDGEETYWSNDYVTFSANAILGSPAEPYVVRFGSTSVSDKLSQSLRVYPNPVECGECFSIGMNDSEERPVRIEMVNALGALVKAETLSQWPARLVAPATAGVYTLKIVVDDKTVVCKRLVVK